MRIEGKLRPDFVIVVDEEWVEWVGISWRTNPQQMRRKNEQEYKRRKSEFTRKGGGRTDLHSRAPGIANYRKQ